MSPRRWRAGATTSIRVPAALADHVLAYARTLDQAWVAPPPPAASALPPRVETPLYDPPAWVRDAVFYQVFVDRFARGAHAPERAGLKRWGNKPGHFDFFGGDLPGLRERLPYLQELGVNALYLNPIFKGASNHKYDTGDYMRIDPHFGSLEDFKGLLADCHARGLRVVLDGVFNHTGDTHAFFKDAVKHGPASPYWHWYQFHGWPVTKKPRPNYAAWWGYAHLPKLRVAQHAAVQAYLHEVTAHWTRLGIDGWRLDVPTEIESPRFWDDWRRGVRAINPEAYLVGEIWEERQDWVHGHPFDALTNYPFRAAMLDFFAQRRISVDALDQRLAGLRARAGGGLLAGFNMLASHDVPRLLTESGGDVARVKEAVFFQLVCPGAPVIYYGEELGLSGGKDPDNRRCMPWSKVRNNELLAHYQRLIALRHAHPALRGPGWQTAFRHNDYRLYAFWREGGGERLLVVLNSGTRPHSPRLPVPGAAMRDLLSGRVYPVAQGHVVIDGLAPHTGLVLAAT